MTRDVSEIFGAFVAGCHGSAVPSEVRARAARYILDAVGCGVGGAATQPVLAAKKALLAPGVKGVARLLGTSLAGTAETAAFLNTLAARAFLFDDTFGDGHLHGGAGLTALALALTEEAGLPFDRAIDAFIAGAEIANRVAYVAGEASYLRGFHNTGTCLVFGCAAAAANVLGLSAAQATAAINLAGERACGLRRYQRGGSPAHSAFHAASAAKSGIECARLALAGFPEPSGMLTGELGFFTSFCPDADPHSIDVKVGTDWWTMRIGIKAFPGCRGTHPAVASTRALVRELGVTPEEIDSLDIAVSPLEGSLCDRPVVNTELAANFSIQYAASRQVVSGRLVSADYHLDSIHAPDVQQFMRRVTVRVDPSLAREAPVRSPTVVTVRSRDGRSATTSMDLPPGEPENPLTDDDLIDKFVNNAEPALGRDRARRAAEEIISGDTRRLVAEILSWCVPAVQRAMEAI